MAVRFGSAYMIGLFLWSVKLINQGNKQKCEKMTLETLQL